jgi:hypothetical protein
MKGNRGKSFEYTITFPAKYNSINSIFVRSPWFIQLIFIDRVVQGVQEEWAKKTSEILLTEAQSDLRSGRKDRLFRNFRKGWVGVSNLLRKN